MSVVGPRPHMVKHTHDYSKIIDKYMLRHLIKPGITGWAQVNGYRGETRELWQMERRVEYDVWYIEHWNFWLDIKIIFLTRKCFSWRKKCILRGFYNKQKKSYKIILSFGDLLSLHPEK